jgi:uncharacterized membrane-anchored protein
MRHQGIAKLDKRTKDLVQRLGPDDIAVIDHVDMDRVSAEALLATGVEVVVNAAASISGAYPNVGPLLLTRGGVTLIDDAGREVFENLTEGDAVEVVGDSVRRDGQVVARTTSQAAGTYRVLLRRGLYTVSVANRPRARVTPTSIRVVPGVVRRVDFELDSSLQ